MKIFVVNLTNFFVPFLFFVIIAIAIPVTPRASKSLLFSSEKKNLLLTTVPNPRIIFVGGSNLSFGLNSQIIKDSLGMNPINTSIHASLGLKYMMESTLKYVKESDIIILVPEYSQYHRSINSGSEELMRIIFDVDILNLMDLSIIQIFNIIPYLPKYGMSKFKITEYFNVKESDIYSVNSFNEFGDAVSHWSLPRQEFRPYPQINTKFNPDVIKCIIQFGNELQKKNAILLISYPGFQSTSYNNSHKQIYNVQNKLEESGLFVIGKADRYKIPDSLMFNTPYHLSKNGVDYRTILLIEDISKALKKLDYN
ncbi:hypothetical protein [Algoriphagus boritolerans]|uniref:DUF1574 domain-containing protein n=1 Tax=Algoriphagus boritolerans DSM 17298 = JCM 18970 TaxID=1120964 RepID=A0A1H5SE37_9BACT|nr:hypothetical protein [Algoriphagus boritolerans]SEF48017.1 hypothetical protein SAMN03080598_00376 [Algoriphagus boritolerans DSM 17298 = JCM 18970]